VIRDIVMPDLIADSVASLLKSNPTAVARRGRPAEEELEAEDD
jgi:hypothetical protein